MKTLTVKQPWASLIVHGIKGIENRTWPTKFRGRILIHSSAKSAGSIYELLTQYQIDRVNNHWTSEYYPNMPYSAIIGSVEIVDCVGFILKAAMMEKEHKRLLNEHKERLFGKGSK